MAISTSCFAKISYNNKNAYTNEYYMFGKSHDEEPQRGEVRFNHLDLPSGIKVPVLEIGDLNSFDYENYGLILAPYCEEMKWPLLIINFIIRCLVSDQTALTMISRLPLRFRTEIRSFRKGALKRLPRNSPLSKWTEVDWFRLQLVPDLYILTSAHNPNRSVWKRFVSYGLEYLARHCDNGLSSACLINDAGVHQNVGLFSFGCLGKFALLIRRFHQGSVSVEIGFPGFLGVFTAFVRTPDTTLFVGAGCCLPHESYTWPYTENFVCSKSGLVPSCYYSRLFLETVLRGDDAVSTNVTKSIDAIPLGPYCLTAARFYGHSCRGVTYHLLQGEGEKRIHTRRYFPNRNVIKYGSASVRTCKNGLVDVPVLPYLLVCSGNLLHRLRLFDPDRSKLDSTYVVSEDFNHVNSNEKAHFVNANADLAATSGASEMFSNFPLNDSLTVYSVSVERKGIRLGIDNSSAASSDRVFVPFSILFHDDGRRFLRRHTSASVLESIGPSPEQCIVAMDSVEGLSEGYLQHDMERMHSCKF